MTQGNFEIFVIKPGILVRDRFGNILDARSTVTLIKGEGSNIIVDTGLGNERSAVLEGLNKQNLVPADIDFLVNTHRHPDHTHHVHHQGPQRRPVHGARRQRVCRQVLKNESPVIRDP